MDKQITLERLLVWQLKLDRVLDCLNRQGDVLERGREALDDYEYLERQRDLAVGAAEQVSSDIRAAIAGL